LEAKASEKLALAAALEEEKRLARAEARFVEPVMALIKAGTFTMGSNDENDDEKPQHLATIEKDFYIGRYEITNIEYNEFLKATKKRVMIPQNWMAEMQPAVGVSWDDANAYAKWLSELTQKRYRLPTEKEWEYAASAGAKTRFYWGDEYQKQSTWFKKYPIIAHDYAWIKSNSNDVTHTVGAKKPNTWGLHDITGNVWEWCSNTYTPDYNTPAEPEEESLKIIRGGSWFSTPDEITLSHRGANVKDFISYSIGFRLVREKE
jgi:formylglycine-generating enzyme required for sulfatase activity